MDPLRELVGEVRGADDRFDQRAVFGRGKRAEGQGDESRVVGEGVEHSRERVSLVDFRLAVAADEKSRRRPETPDDVLERFDRDLGGVEVLQGQDERLSRRHPRQRPCQQLENLDPIFCFALRRGRCDAGVSARRGAQLADLCQKREERKEVGRDVGEIRALRAGASRIARAEVVLNQFAETLIGERLVLFDEPAVEDTDLAHGDELLQLLEEPRLADPRLSRYDGKLAVAGER